MPGPSLWYSKRIGNECPPSLFFPGRIEECGGVSLFNMLVATMDQPLFFYRDWESVASCPSITVYEGHFLLPLREPDRAIPCAIRCEWLRERAPLIKGRFTTFALFRNRTPDTSPTVLGNANRGLLLPSPAAWRKLTSRNNVIDFRTLFLSGEWTNLPFPLGAPCAGRRRAFSFPRPDELPAGPPFSPPFPHFSNGIVREGSAVLFPVPT